MAIEENINAYLEKRGYLRKGWSCKMIAPNIAHIFNKKGKYYHLTALSGQNANFAVSLFSNWHKTPRYLGSTLNRSIELGMNLVEDYRFFFSQK